MTITIASADLVWRSTLTQCGMIKESVAGTTPSGSVVYPLGGLSETVEPPDPEVDLGQYWAAGGGRPLALISTKKFNPKGRAPSVIVQDPRMIALAFGSDAVTGSAGDYTHTITCSETGPLPTFTLESAYKAITGAGQGQTASVNFVRSCAGCKIASMSVGVSKESELKADFEIQGWRKPATGTSFKTLTLDQVTAPYKFSMANFSFNSVGWARVLDWTYRLENQLQPMWYNQNQVTDTQYPYEIMEGGVKHTLEATLVVSDSSIYSLLLGGESFNGWVTFNRGANDSLTFSWGGIVIQGAPHPIGSADGPISVKMRAIAKTATCTAVNAVSSSYT